MSIDIFDVTIFLFAFGISCFLIVLTKYIPRLAGRSGDLSAVQAAHASITPRVGGVAIFGAIMFMSAFVPDIVASNYAKFLPAVGIIFFVGLCEDLGFRVSPWGRLTGAIVASLFFIIASGVWMPRVDIPVLDGLMPYWFIGIPMTLFVTAGAANGFNLIDGVNGLAGFSAIACAIGLAFLGAYGGYPEMSHLAVMIAAAILGFLVMNYPFGLLFLGDAGAYTIGFVLSWFGISVILRAPEVSAWAVLLTLYWPVFDTLLAIFRRVSRRAPSFHPDRMHVHQLIMRSLEIVWLSRGRRNLSNPLSSLLLTPFILAPVAVGVLLWNRPLAAGLSFFGFLLLGFASYAALAKLPAKLRRSGKAVGRFSTGGSSGGSGDPLGIPGE